MTVCLDELLNRKAWKMIVCDVQALNICKIESIIDRNSLELTRSMLSSSSRARPFYIHLIKQHASGEMLGHRDLISRVKLTCKKYGISLLKYIFDDSY